MQLWIQLWIFPRRKGGAVHRLDLLCRRFIRRSNLRLEYPARQIEVCPNERCCWNRSPFWASVQLRRIAKSHSPTDGAQRPQKRAPFQRNRSLVLRVSQAMCHQKCLRMCDELSAVFVHFLLLQGACLSAVFDSLRPPLYGGVGSICCMLYFHACFCSSLLRFDALFYASVAGAMEVA